MMRDDKVANTPDTQCEASSNNIPESKRVSQTTEPANKWSYKLPRGALKAIIDLTLAGYKIDDIQLYLLETFGIKIHVQTIKYHRRRQRKKIQEAIEKDIEITRAMYPETALLVGRIRILQEVLEKELNKRRNSGHVIASLIEKADTAMYRAEMLRLRYKDIERKYPIKGDDQAEAILQELDRRSHIIRNVTHSADEIGELAGEEFLVHNGKNEQRLIRGDVCDNQDGDILENEELLTK
jgi:hypothetical protein